MLLVVTVDSVLVVVVLVEFVLWSVELFCVAGGGGFHQLTF